MPPSPILPPKPEVIKTLNLDCRLLFTNAFQKNWFGVDDVITVTLWPIILRFKFCSNVFFLTKS